MNQLALKLEKHLSSQNRDVLSCLRLYGYIDPLIARDAYAIMRLAPRICELRQQGYNIQTEMVPFVSLHNRRGAFARYTLCQ